MKRALPGALRSHNTKLVSTKADGGKLFGKYDELVRLVLGFVLTGVVGAYLSHKYTTQQSDLAAAGKVFNEHSKLIGDRYFAMNQVTAPLRELQRQPQSQPSAELQAAWSKYKVVVQEWNSSRGFNREMIKLYFGQPLWNSERDIHYQFRAWGQSLEAEYKARGAVDFGCLDSKIDGLLVLSHGLRVGMAEAMQEGKVGSARDGALIKENPREDAWCLVKQEAPNPSIEGTASGLRPPAAAHVKR